MTRKRPPASPLYSGLYVAAMAFVLPVIFGLVSGNMSKRDFSHIVLLTVGGFLVGYLTAVVQRRHRAT